jgi:flagellar P-ring protein FlgI
MKVKLFILMTAFFIMQFEVTAMVKLKDLVTIKGVRSNPLIGYGLVIGLNGTGDGGGEITNQSLKRMFIKLGLNPKEEIVSKNVAAVIVTAELPPFARVGQKIDIKVSSIGDSSSLAGGTLLITPLKGGDGNIYAISSGSISIGGLNNGSKFPTTGLVINGGTIEKEIAANFDKNKTLRLSLNNADFTTSARVEKTLNQELGGKFAIARDSATIDFVVPTFYQRKVIQLISIIENLKVNVEQVAKIVINERTGTIVAGGDVQLKTAAISHGDLSIEINAEGQDGANVKPKRFHFLKNKTNLSDLVKALNTLGASPEDLIAIFQTLKRNGALIGSIEFI